MAFGHKLKQFQAERSADRAAKAAAVAARKARWAAELERRKTVRAEKAARAANRLRQTGPPPDVPVVVREAGAERITKCCWCGEALGQPEGEVYWLCPTGACQARQWRWTVAKPAREGGVKALYVPSPIQVTATEQVLTTKYTLFGGAAGGSKSHWLRWLFYQVCLVHAGASVLLLRRTFPELERTHIREAQREARGLGAEYRSDHTVRFPNGSLFEFGHCEDAKAASKYLSTEYDGIGFDELVTFEEAPTLEIMTRARVKPALQAQGLRAFVVAGSNPGGRGALWVRDRFIDRVVDPDVYPNYRPAEYGFVPAKLEDNPYRDVQYEATLANLPPHRYRQLRDGDWYSYEGQFFSQWAPSVHVRDLAWAA